MQSLILLVPTFTYRNVSGSTLSKAADVTETSLTAAIAAFEEEPMGRVVEIRFVDENRHERFEGVVETADAVTYLSIDPTLRGVRKLESGELPAWMVCWQPPDPVGSASREAISLADAVSRAEGLVKGPAIGAGRARRLQGSTDALAYNVELMRDGKRRRVTLDAATGARIANPDESYEAWSPVRLVSAICLSAVFSSESTES